MPYIRIQALPGVRLSGRVRVWGPPWWAGLPRTHHPLLVFSRWAPSSTLAGLLSFPRPFSSKDRHCFGAWDPGSWNKLCLATLLNTDVSNPMEYEFNFQLEIRGPCLLAGERETSRWDGWPSGQKPKAVRDGTGVGRKANWPRWQTY